MADLPGFEELWGSFVQAKVSSVLKNNPMLEELCKVIFAAAVAEVVKAGARVPQEMMPVYMLKLAASATEAGIQSVDRLLDLMNKQGAGTVTGDLHGVFVPGEFKV